MRITENIWKISKCNEIWIYRWNHGIFSIVRVFKQSIIVTLIFDHFVIFDFNNIITHNYSVVCYYYLTNCVSLQCWNEISKCFPEWEYKYLFFFFYSWVLCLSFRFDENSDDLWQLRQFFQLVPDTVTRYRLGKG